MRVNFIVDQPLDGQYIYYKYNPKGVYWRNSYKQIGRVLKSNSKNHSFGYEALLDTDFIDFLAFIDGLKRKKKTLDINQFLSYNYE